MAGAPLVDRVTVTPRDTRPASIVAALALAIATVAATSSRNWLAMLLYCGVVASIPLLFSRLAPEKYAWCEGTAIHGDGDGETSGNGNNDDGTIDGTGGFTVDGVASGVPGIVIRSKGFTVQALGGFECTAMPTKVHGNVARVLQVMTALPGIEFHVVMARHLLPGSRDVAGPGWFSAGGRTKAAVPASRAGDAWLLVAARRLSIARDPRGQVIDFQRSLLVLRKGLQAFEPHHRFDDVCRDRLVAAWRLVQGQGRGQG